MKKIKNILILLFTVSAMISCEESDNDVSQITFLPLITVNGESSIELDCDATGYTDEGAVATEDGEEIDLETTIDGTYFGSTEVDGPDAYSVTYSAVNVDGIPGAKVREVVWPPCKGDFVTSIAGVYMADVDRNSGGEVYEELSPIYVIDLGGGVFQISDAIGGFYEYGRGFGNDYAATGMTVTVNDLSANDFTYTDVIGVGAFGGDLMLTSFSVDTTNKTISLVADWDAGGGPSQFVFEVILTQI